jgi:hypothetical protein
MTVTINYRGLELIVDGTYHKATRDVPYLRNGDPGYPGDPAEFEIGSVKLGEVDMIDFFDGLFEEWGGVKRTYTEPTLNIIESLCIEQAEDKDNERCDDDV